MRMHQCQACGKELRDVDGVDVCRDPSCGWRAEPEDEAPKPDRYVPERQPKVKRAFGRMVLDEPPENATKASADAAAEAAREAIKRAREKAANEESVTTQVDDESPIGGSDG